MTAEDLSVEVETEIEEFSSAEAARVAEIVAKNAKRRARDRENELSVVQYYVQERQWPESHVAKDWLKNADPTHKLGASEGVLTVQKCRQQLQQQLFRYLLQAG